MGSGASVSLHEVMMHAKGPGIQIESTMLELLLPASVASAEIVGDPVIEGTLFAEEEAALGAVSEKRRRDFTAGRYCARLALNQLGVGDAAILPRADRSPRWPSGMVGSITHCAGYCGCAVARRTEIASMGIDAEVHQPLPSEIQPLVTIGPEREWLESVEPSPVHWGTVLFSAKESTYKAWFPLAGTWLDFSEALISIDRENRTWRARLLVPGPVLGGRPIGSIEGQFLVHNGLVITTALVPLPDSAQKRGHE